MTNRNIKIPELLEMLIDDMLEGFQVIDDEWRYLYVNDTVAKQGKKKKEELLGKTMMETYPGIENTPMFGQLKKCKKEQVRIKMDNEFEFPDGSKGMFRLLISPWERGVMILSIDITERKELEDKLYEKIDELNKVTKHMVGRELKLAELKKTIASLNSAANEARGYQ